MSTTNIYILRLEGGKYYIGKTNNINRRKQEHLNGTASVWTRKYRPISVEKIIPDASPFDEDKYTKEYMAKYGIDNVRGGSYVSEVLDDVQKYSVQKEIWGANDLCTQCGRKGHFVKNCYAKKKVNSKSTKSDSESDDESEEEDEEDEDADEDEDEDEEVEEGSDE